MSEQVKEPSSYLDLYKYLLILTDTQITKLRNIALGIVSLSAFSKAELKELDQHLLSGAVQVQAN